MGLALSAADITEGMLAPENGCVKDQAAYIDTQHFENKQTDAHYSENQNQNTNKPEPERKSTDYHTDFKNDSDETEAGINPENDSDETEAGINPENDSDEMGSFSNHENDQSEQEHVTHSDDEQSEIHRVDVKDEKEVSDKVFFIETECGQMSPNSVISANNVMRHLHEAKGGFKLQKSKFHPEYKEKQIKKIWNAHEALQLLHSVSGNHMTIEYTNGYSNFSLTRMNETYYHVEVFCSAIEEVSVVKGRLL